MKGQRKTRLILCGLVCVSFIMLLFDQAEVLLPEIVRDLVTLSLGVIYEAFPFIILGTLLATIVKLYVPESLLLSLLPKQSMVRRGILSVSGSLLPVCECGNVPLARGLMTKGIKPQDALTFILAAPIINPVTALTTHQAFGAQPLLLPLRLLGAFCISNLVGWLYDNEKSSNTMLNDYFKYHCESCHNENMNSKKRKQKRTQRIKEFSATFQTELSTLIPPLLFGSLLAGIIQTVIPRSFLNNIATEPVLAILIMLVLAFIVSICANVDAFFALSFSGIFPMSAILAFLVFGPMIDMKMLALLRTTYTARTLTMISTIVFFSSFLFALGAHYVI